MGVKSGKPGPDPGIYHIGRPQKVLDIEVLKRSAAIGCSQAEIAALQGISVSTFWEHLQRDPGLQATIDEARENGRGTLRRFQWQQAAAGNPTMLIWLGKQMLGQRDRQEVSGPEGGAIELIVTGVRRALDAPANDPED